MMRPVRFIAPLLGLLLLAAGAWHVSGLVIWSSGADAVPPPRPELAWTVLPAPPPGSPEARDMAVAPLSAVKRMAWRGRWEVWAAAMADCLLDPMNPLRLSPEERGRSLELFRLMIHRFEQYSYRMDQLRQALAKWFRPTDELDLPPSYYIPEEELLARLPGLRRTLEARAGGHPRAHLEPDPFGEDIVMQCASELAEGMSEEQERSEGLVGVDEEFGTGLSPGELAAYLETIVDQPDPEAAARALLLLDEIETASRTVRDCWLELSAIAMRGERADVVRKQADRMEPVLTNDLGTIYDSILKASARQLLKERTWR